MSAGGPDAAGRPRRPGQQVLAGMPERLYPCTPTRLTTWLDCPRRYRFAYLERPMPPKGPPWAHTTMGTAAHTALAAWWSLPFARRTPRAGRDLVRQGWRDDRPFDRGFADAAQERSARDPVAGWVEDYLGGVDPAVEPLGVERTVAVPAGSLALSGRVDRIDEGPGRTAVVVDYKTGRRPPEPEEARTSLALAIYAMAATRTLRRECRRVELHHLPTGTVVAAEHDERSIGRKLGEAESIARDARAADGAFAAGERGDRAFPPRVSPLCSWCDWREHCPEGRAAAPERPRWSRLLES